MAEITASMVMDLRSRTGLPASLLTSEPDFQRTARSIS